MIAEFCFFLFAILTVRSLILGFAELKSWPRRFFDFLLVLFFGGCAFFLLLFLGLRFSQDPAPNVLLFAGMAAPVAFFVYLRLRKPYSNHPAVLGAKTILVLILLCLSLIVVMMSGFLYLTEDQPVLKVIITGKRQNEFVEWKPPDERLQKQYLPAYEVVLETPEGKSVSKLSVYGDQVAVKAKVIRFRPILNAIGFHNLCRIEYVYNGYISAARFNFYPHKAHEISLPHPEIAPFQNAFWSFWENLYYQQTQNAWIKSATLESSYFPLLNPDGSPFRGSFYITITPGGLSSVPLP